MRPPREPAVWGGAFRSYSISGLKHFSCAFPNYNAAASPVVNDGNSNGDKDMPEKCLVSGFVPGAATCANVRLLDGNKPWLAVSYLQSESTFMGTVLINKKSSGPARAFIRRNWSFEPRTPGDILTDVQHHTSREPTSIITL
jgi:hypothetical protein